jgi:hypothetical protein
MSLRNVLGCFAAVALAITGYSVVACLVGSALFLNAVRNGGRA